MRVTLLTRLEFEGCLKNMDRKPAIGFPGDLGHWLRLKLLRSRNQSDNIVLVKEPGGCYVDHLTPLSGRAAGISSGIVKFVLRSNSDNTLINVGSDGTAVNTVAHSGILRRIEVMLG